jgi:hypothetical protein
VMAFHPDTRVEEDEGPLSSTITEMTGVLMTALFSPVR